MLVGEFFEVKLHLDQLVTIVARNVRIGSGAEELTVSKSFPLRLTKQTSIAWRTLLLRAMSSAIKHGLAH